MQSRGRESGWKLTLPTTDSYDWLTILQVNRATQAEEDNLEMQVRAANMVRAGESLMKLVSDLKIYLILNDFPNVNEAISSNSRMFKDMQVIL